MSRLLQNTATSQQKRSTTKLADANTELPNPHSLILEIWLSNLQISIKERKGNMASNLFKIRLGKGHFILWEKLFVRSIKRKALLLISKNESTNKNKFILLPFEICLYRQISSTSYLIPLKIGEVEIKFRAVGKASN